jgi:hypothetical protein
MPAGWSGGQPGCMTNSAFAANGEVSSPVLRQLSPRLSASAAGLVAVGAVTGLVSFLRRSPVRQPHVPGTSAWAQQLIVLAVACALYAAARRRRGRRRRSGRGSGTLLLLAPLGRRAAARLAATMWQRSWRPAAALPPLALIAYSCWRTGDQITGGLDPNFTVNAWGGPTYLGAMACHYLDAGLIIAACAWLLDQVMLPASAGRR